VLIAACFPLRSESPISDNPVDYLVTGSVIRKEGKGRLAVLRDMQPKISKASG
jgi:hypothetical protein